jgi:hypothetical protein
VEGFLHDVPGQPPPASQALIPVLIPYDVLCRPDGMPLSPQPATGQLLKRLKLLGDDFGGRRGAGSGSSEASHLPAGASAAHGDAGSRGHSSAAAAQAAAAGAAAAASSPHQGLSSAGSQGDGGGSGLPGAGGGGLQGLSSLSLQALTSMGLQELGSMSLQALGSMGLLGLAAQPAVQAEAPDACANGPQAAAAAAQPPAGLQEGLAMLSGRPVGALPAPSSLPAACTPLAGQAMGGGPVAGQGLGGGPVGRQPWADLDVSALMQLLGGAAGVGGLQQGQQGQGQPGSSEGV